MRPDCEARRYVRPRLEALEDRCLLSAEQYVTALYADLLHRTAQQSELAGWVSQLQSGATPQQVALAFTASVEYRTNLVVDHYRNFLGREPGGNEVQFWVGQFNAGLTDQRFTAAVLASTEYVMRNQPQPPPGAVIRASIEPWLRAVYRDVLGRNLDATGREAWLSALASLDSHANSLTYRFRL